MRLCWWVLLLLLLWLLWLLLLLLCPRLLLLLLLLCPRLLLLLLLLRLRLCLFALLRLRLSLAMGLGVIHCVLPMALNLFALLAALNVCIGAYRDGREPVRNNFL